MKYIFGLAISIIFSTLATASDLDDYQALISEEWIKITSENLEVITNANAEKGIELANKLETFRKIFLLSTGMTASPDASKLRVYALPRTDFSTLTKTSVTMGGFFTVLDIDTDAAFIKIDGFNSGNGSTRQNDISTLILYHEYVHYLVATSTNGQVYYPPWYNEGMAEFFSTAYMPDASTIVVGKPPAFRIRGLPNRDKRHRDDPWLNMATIFASQQGLPKSNISDTYAQAWLIYHFMYADPERIKQSVNYLKDLSDGKPHLQAFTDNYKMTPVEMNNELLAYYQRGNMAFSTYKLPKPLTIPEATTLKLNEDQKHDMLANTFIRHLKDSEKRVQFTKDLAKEYPATIAILDSLGYIAYAEKKTDTLADIVKKMMDVSPTDRRTILAKSHLAELRYESSKNAAEKQQYATEVAELMGSLIKQNKRDAHAIMDIAKALDVLGEDKNMTNALELRAWQLRPRFPELAISVAKNHLEENQPQKALNILQVMKKNLGDNAADTDIDELILEIEKTSGEKAIN